VTRFLPYAVDVAAVLVFVAIGRRSHEEAGSFVGFVATAAPFLLGAAASWVILAVARPGGSLVPALSVWAVTVLVGVLLRRFAFGEGAPASFVVVTSLVLALLMVGGRLLAERLA
jgi:hypothetical protein